MRPCRRRPRPQVSSWHLRLRSSPLVTVLFGPAEGPPKCGRCMHGEMHGGAERGVGPLPGNLLCAGAHKAINDDALVPQANKSSMVPMTRNARPATKRHRGVRQERPDDMGAGHEEIAENAAKAVGQRPALRLRQRRERGGEQQHGGGPSEQPQPAAFRRVAEHEMPSPGGQRQEEDDRGEPQGLDGKVGDHGAPGSEHVAGRGPRRIVEARVVHRPGGKACPGGAGRRHDAQPIGAEHEPAQARLDRAWQQPAAALSVSAWWPSPNPKWRRCASTPRAWCRRHARERP